MKSAAGHLWLLLSKTVIVKDSILTWCIPTYAYIKQIVYIWTRLAIEVALYTQCFPDEKKKKNSTGKSLGRDSNPLPGIAIE